MLKYQIAQSENCLTFVMTGKLMMCQGSQGLVKDLNALNDESSVRVLFDCGDVSMIDSSGIGVLVVCKKVIDDAGGALAIYVRKDGMMNRAITSTSLEKIFKIFYDRQEAADYLKSRHQEPDELKNILLKGMKDIKPLQEDLLLCEMNYQYPKLEDVIAQVESVALELNSNGSSPLTVAAQQNRLVLFLAKLVGRYPIVSNSTEKNALIIDRDNFALAGYMADLILQNSGWLTMNLSGMTVDSKRIAEVVNAFSPGLVVICSGGDANIDNVLNEAHAILKLNEEMQVSVYMPVFQTINKNPPEDEKICFVARIQDFAYRFCDDHKD